MQNELAFSTGALFSFLLVLARISGAFVFVPIPGMKEGTESARIFAALAVTVALFPLWPTLAMPLDGVGTLVAAVLLEAAFGSAIGLAVAFFTEALQMTAQLVATQAGYSFASMIDPSTNADSGLLLVVAQLTGALCFFTLGLHREVIRIFAMSLTTQPPGGVHVGIGLADSVLHLGGEIFVSGVRLALPAIALLVLIDLSLALLGRLNAHLQLISLSFPIKMLVALALMSVLTALYPKIYAGGASRMIGVARAIAAAPAHGR